MKKQVAKKKLILATETLTQLQLARVAGGDSQGCYVADSGAKNCP